ncbi:hypothetical protein [Cellvibrio polysaccharolyticus]|uniref:Uncharacterized protein n=1 Tax=Cellvibrio polysaccharolyticus TaxID=2082724 RepID=A0A928YSJ6_9GAMM|nr:hypothetical protein [Cellvibrio polysaccharolyticus]MBE8715827.1 hypothetical protein [Cellvibrio polysaccharolyticus]
MKKELIIVLFGAVLGGASTFGFDVLKSKYMKLDDPLSDGVRELTSISKELVLEQSALNGYLNDLVTNVNVPQEIKVEINQIENRVNNFLQVAAAFEERSRTVVGITKSFEEINKNRVYNADADLVLANGQAVTLCGNENTLAVDASGKFSIRLNGSAHYPSVGSEFHFSSPSGRSMISYLGKTYERYKFRVVCVAEIKK